MRFQNCQLLNMAYKYRKFINFYASFPFQVAMKLYQFAGWTVFVWLTTPLKHFYEINDTMVLFIGLYLLLNLLLFLMQMNRAIVRPVRSQDLVAVLVIGMAQVNILYDVWKILTSNIMNVGCTNCLQHCPVLFSVGCSRRKGFQC